MMPSIDKSPETATLELVERQRKLYEGCLLYTSRCV